jgi:xylulokinase
VAEEMCAAFGASLDDLTAAAAAAPAGAGGLLLVPYFQGERVPNLPEASGALAGIRPGLLRPAHLFRAALEGTMLSLALGIERLERLGIQVESVRVVGGGAQNTLWCQILADVMARPVTRLPEPESAALGAAVQAWWTVRRAGGETVGADTVAAQCVATEGAAIAPDRRHTDVYRDSRERLRSTVGRLFG